MSTPQEDYASAYNGIDITFPVAGQDNNSQGFRSNFGNIQAAFAAMNAIITTLNQTIVVKGPTAVNDLNGGLIENGVFNQFYGITTSDIVPDGSDRLDVSLLNGPLQEITLHTATNYMVFKDWPSVASYASVRLHLINNSGQIANIAPFETENNFVVIYDDSITNTTIAIDTGKQAVIEAWNYDAGNNIYVRLLGVFDAPTSQ